MLRGELTPHGTLCGALAAHGTLRGVLSASGRPAPPDGDFLAYGRSTAPLVNVAAVDSAVIEDYAGSVVGHALVGLAIAG